MAVLGCLLAGPIYAQGSVASSLWRVAAGTLVVPAALADDGGSALWTPAVALAGEARYRVGFEAIHAPSEVGINGGVLAFSARTRDIGIISVVYGRLGMGGVGYTETSPEIVGPAIAIYNQTASLGVSRTLKTGLVGGVALRFLSGRLGTEERSQFGLDAGVQYAGMPNLRLGAATHFFDPTFGASGEATSYSLGAEYRSDSFDAWGAETTIALRYGVTAGRGTDTQQLLTAGVTFGPALTVDLGGAREHTPVQSLWRSRLGVGIGAGRYTVRIGRDGGVNGFGATYRFGLTAVFQ